MINVWEGVRGIQVQIFEEHVNTIVIYKVNSTVIKYVSLIN